MPQANERLAVALDFEELAPARRLAQQLQGIVRILKIGPRLFVSAGPDAIRTVRELGFDVFLDLKFHDIPATVGGACRAATALGVRYLTVHVAGGAEMMRWAVEQSRDEADLRGLAAPTILGITVLTSLSLAGPEAVLAAGRSAANAGLGGLVAAAQEVGALRKEVGPGLVLVTPGIRPAGSAAVDQSRIATPSAAIAAGADLLVVGRPIYQAAEPGAAAQAIIEEIRQGSALA